MVCQSECKRRIITSLTWLNHGFITSVNVAGCFPKLGCYKYGSILQSAIVSLVVEGSSLSESVLIPCFCALRGMALEMVGERP